MATPSSIAAQPPISPAITKFIEQPPRLLIGGEWVESQSRAAVDVFDPSTGQRIAAVPDANAHDVNRAVAAARRAFESGPWPDMQPAQRQGLLWKLSDLIDANAAELAE